MALLIFKIKKSISIVYRKSRFETLSLRNYTIGSLSRAWKKLISLQFLKLQAFLFFAGIAKIYIITYNLHGRIVALLFFQKKCHGIQCNVL